MNCIRAVLFGLQAIKAILQIRVFVQNEKVGNLETMTSLKCHINKHLLHINCS